MLHVAPSAINRQILEYERELGLPLFDRVPRGLRLTSAGEAVLGYIRRADMDHDLMLAQLRLLQGQEGGRVRLVSASGLVGHLLPAVLGPFCARHPRVDVSVDVVSLEDILASVAQGDADLGVGFDLPRDPRVGTMVSVTQRLGFVVRPDHPLAGHSSVRLSDCVGAPLILPHPESTIRQLLDVAFAEGRIEPLVVMSSNSVEMRKKMVLAGVGMTVLSPVDVMGEVADRRLAHLPIGDALLPGQTLKLIARAQGALEPLQARMAEDLRQALAALPDRALQ